MSKTKEEAAFLTEAFRNMTEAFHAKDNSTSLNKASRIEENNYSILPSKNPFLINSIISCLFGFLPLDDVKRSRLVCREWCSTAGVCLRKRSAINFGPNGLLPLTFMGASKHSHPDLSFNSFVFSTVSENTRLRIDWQISEIQDFFEKWENNIKEVKFNYILLARKCNVMDKVILIPEYNVTPLFINPSNITSLIIRQSMFYGETTDLEISLEKFVSIKTLYLSDCTIIVSAENHNSTRIAPLNIDFRMVSFEQNGQILQNFHYNDIIDFSKALNIHLKQFPAGAAIFDMGMQVFNSNQIHLERIPVKNWALAKGSVQFLSLDYVPFEEKNNLKIKQLKFANSKIDLSALPKSLEFLNLSDCSIKIINTGPFLLPNLKYLFLDIRYSNILELFSNSTILKELEIRNFKPRSEPNTLSVGCIPKSVEIMRMHLNQKLKITDNCSFELVTLILGCSNCSSGVTECMAFTAKVKAKVLVIDLNAHFEIDTLDIVKLVEANKQSQKITISSDSDLHENIPFEGSEFSKCVDKKSNVYQFENGIGKSLTEEEFQRCYKGKDYLPRHFNHKAIYI